jgi:hypothetical protein
MLQTYNCLNRAHREAFPDSWSNVRPPFAEGVLEGKFTITLWIEPRNELVNLEGY